MANGNPKENKVRALLQELGYFLASTRHVGGAGDLVAIAPVVQTRVGNLLIPSRARSLLAEVKATVEIPWSAGGDCFGPDRRAAMISAGVEFNLEPILCWWPPRHGPIWLPVEDWPA